MTIVKIMLHISYAEQGERLRQRLDDPTKYWKYNPADIDERAYWDDYQAAYADALTRCSTEVAPWYVVPANQQVVPRLGGRHHPRRDTRRSRAALPAAGFRSIRNVRTRVHGDVNGR